MDTALFLTLFLFAVQTAAGVAPMRWPNHTWLAGWIFYLSGFFAIACFVWWGLSNRAWLMLPNIQPAQIIAFGLAVALGGLIWHWRSVTAIDATPPQIVINAPPSVAPAPATSAGPVRLIPNEIPDVPAETAKRVARYWQLKGALARAIANRQNLEATGLVYRDKMKPFDIRKDNRPNLGYVGRWQSSQKELQTINDLVYKNRPLDLKSAPDLAYPTSVAPDEAAFPEEAAAKRYEYRAFHFLLKNIFKQSDQLVSDLEKEAASIKEALVSVPPEKLEQ